jgi:hypothetical protein
MKLLMAILLFCIGNIIYCQNNNISSGEKIAQSDELAENRIKDKKPVRRKNNSGHIFNNVKNNIITSEINEKTTLTDNRRIYLLKKYGYTDGLRIFQGKLWQGMTIDMVLESKGIPYSVNRNVTRGGTSERWIYSELYLFFENGILTSILANKQIVTSDK